MSNSASSRTASGIGTITASSAAVNHTLSQACFEVCFIPVSPFTQYAVGKKSNTLIRVCLDVMLGNFFAIAINVDDFGVSCAIASTICSRIIASAFSLLIIFVAMSYLLFFFYCPAIKLLMASFALAFLSSGSVPPCIGPGVELTT